MPTIPAKIIKCECGKLIVLNALSLPYSKCPKCGKIHKPY